MSQTYNPIELCTTVTKALLNNNFNAVRSNFSGATFPSSPVGGQFFVHTGTEPWTLYLYNSDDLSWVPVTTLTLEADPLVTFITALSNAADPTEGAELVGYRRHTVHNKLDRVIDVKDFGAVCDGSTDDTDAVQAALDYVGSTFGYGVVRINGRVYCASSITLPDQVGICGFMPSIGAERMVAFPFDEIPNALLLSNTASVILGDGSSVCDLYILNKNLDGLYPFSDYTDVQDAVANFDGIAISGDHVEDIKIQHCRIIGFAQAVYTDFCNRHKIDFVEVDCTAGIWINDSFDISRISNCHFWPFLSYAILGLVNMFNRTGSAYKVTGEFDGGVIKNCFSYGYAVGFDIQCPQGISIENCVCDSFGGVGSTNIGNVGFKFSVDVMSASLKGGLSLAQGYGLQIDGTSAEIDVDDCKFWGNNTHIKCDAAKLITIQGCIFGYLNAWPTSDYFLIIDGVSGYVQIRNNTFYGARLGTGNAYYDGINILNQTFPIHIVGNTFIKNSTALTIDASSAAIITIQSNDFSTCATGIVFGNDVAENLADIRGNGYIPGYSKPNMAQGYGGWGFGSKGFGTTALNVHVNEASGGTASSPAAVGTGKTIASHRFYAYTGTGMVNGASIRAATHGSSALGASSCPINLIFSTCAIGSVTLTDRLVLSTEGHLYPLTDNAYTCGANGARFASFWGANGTIQTSDERTKTEIAKSNLGLEFILDLIPISYKFIEGGKRVVDVDEEGTPIKVESIKGKRRHYGFTSQKVHEVASKFTDDFGGFILTDPSDPESEQGLRYEEFISPIVKAIQELHTVVKSQEGVISKLKSRIKVLEGNLTGLVKLK